LDQISSPFATNNFKELTVCEILADHASYGDFQGGRCFLGFSKLFFFLADHSIGTFDGILDLIIYFFHVINCKKSNDSPLVLLVLINTRKIFLNHGSDRVILHLRHHNLKIRQKVFVFLFKHFHIIFKQKEKQSIVAKFSSNSGVFATWKDKVIVGGQFFKSS
jgi:hypothetical protein